MMEPPMLNLTDLPAAAHQVVASKLSGPDRAAYRLACRQLAGIVKQTAAPLWIVANTFKAQYEQGGDRDLTADSLARAAEGVTAAHVLVDSSRSCGGDVWIAMFSALMTSNTLTSLVITEYNTFDFREHAAALLIREDPEADFGDNGALLTAADCAWLPALIAAANARPLLQQQHQQLQQLRLQLQLKQQQPAATEAAAVKKEAATVSAAPPADVPLSLTLELMTPLSDQHAQQLVELQCLQSLAIVKTPLWFCHWAQQLRPDCQLPPQPALLLATAARLRGLRQLSSLTCTLGLSRRPPPRPPQMDTDSLPPSEAALGSAQLHQMLMALGSQLTQLHIGTQQFGKVAWQLQLELAAPLEGMPALKDLTLSIGCTLEAVDSLQLEQPTADAAAGGRGDSGNSSGQPSLLEPPLQHLTRLVCLDHSEDLQYLTRQVLASQAVRSQLQRLMLPSLPRSGQGQPLDVLAPAAAPDTHWLAELEGLRELRVVVKGRQELDAVVAAVGSRLQGFTVYCEWVGRGSGLVVPPNTDHLLGAFQSCSQLTSLKIVDDRADGLDPSLDLAPIGEHLPALRQLYYAGWFGATFGVSNPSGSFTLREGMLPAGLQGLTVVNIHRSPNAEGLFTAVPGTFPTGLTSLKCKGFTWQCPADTGGVDVPWEQLPAGLRVLQVDIWWTGASTRDTVARPAQQQAVPATLPSLETLLLGVRDRQPGGASEDEEDKSFLILDDVLNLLPALSGLRQLQVSSTLLYCPGSTLNALRRFRQLRVLSLDIDLDREEEDLMALVAALEDSLADATGLRLLRLPCLNGLSTMPSALEKLEMQHPNRMLVASYNCALLKGDAFPPTPTFWCD